MKYNFTINLMEVLDLFVDGYKNYSQHEDYYSDYPNQVFSEFTIENLRFEQNMFNKNRRYHVDFIDSDFDFNTLMDTYFYPKCKTSRTLEQIYADAIDRFFEDVVDLYNDPEHKLETSIEFTLQEDNETLDILLDTENIDRLISLGMNGYGMFDWNLHSEEDKQKFREDPYLLLREMLHYYEACMNKPRLKDDLSLDNIRYIPSASSIFNDMLDAWIEGKDRMVIKLQQAMVVDLVKKFNEWGYSIRQLKTEYPELAEDFDETFDNALVTIQQER